MHEDFYTKMFVILLCKTKPKYPDDTCVMLWILIDKLKAGCKMIHCKVLNYVLNMSHIIKRVYIYMDINKRLEGNPWK